jgi:Trypsin
MNRFGRALWIVLCLTASVAGASADTGGQFGPPRGKIEVFTQPTLELVQALLTLAGMPTAQGADRSLLGEVRLGATGAPVVGRIVEDAIDRMPYFDLVVPLKKLAAGERADALDLAFKLSLDASGQKLVVTDEDEVVLHWSFAFGSGFNRDAFVDAFGTKLLHAAEAAAGRFLGQSVAATYGNPGHAMSQAEAERVIAAAPQETRPVFKSQQTVLQTMLASARQSDPVPKAGMDEDCDWCLVPGVMTHYALVFRDRQSPAWRAVEIGNAVAPTFNRHRPEILELINRFNASVPTPARAFIANSGDIYVEYAYSVQLGLDPVYVGEVGARAMPAAAKALMDLLMSKPLEEALQLDHTPPAEADPSRFPARLVGRLVLKYASGESGVCTGSLVGPALVLTAAHCVKPHEKDGSYSRVIRGIFQLGYNREDWTAEALVEQTTTSEDYSDDPKFIGDRRHDWALVRLSDDLPGHAGEVAVKKLDDRQLTQSENHHFFALGYGSYSKEDPGEIMLQSPYSLLSWSLPFQYVSSDSEGSDERDRIMVFAGKAVPGDSGGPVFLEESGKLYLVGIAIAGYSDLYETESGGFSPNWRFSPHGDIAFVVPAAEFIDKLEAMQKGESPAALPTTVARTLDVPSQTPQRKPTPR